MKHYLLIVSGVYACKGILNLLAFVVTVGTNQKQHTVTFGLN